MSKVSSEIAGVFLVIILILCVFGLGACWGEVMYDNWKCGLPGVECRIDVVDK